MNHALSVTPNNISETLRWIADGPCVEVPKFNGYKINGVHFSTKCRDDVRTVQNSGVYLLADAMQVASSKDKNPVITDMVFYGVIQEIWELDYYKFRLPIFKCDWVENQNGIKIDELGFTLVNLSRLSHKPDKFVLGRQVKQVFYVEDPADSRWSVVLSTPDRDDIRWEDELGNTTFDLQPFTTSLPPVETFDDIVGETGTEYVRPGGEGIWID